MSTLENVIEAIIKLAESLAYGEQYKYIPAASLYIDNNGRWDWDAVANMEFSIENMVCTCPDIYIELLYGSDIPSVVIVISRKKRYSSLGRILKGVIGVITDETNLYSVNLRRIYRGDQQN